ncbi:D-alanyl-D-alanine carboxypeptidase family protein [Methylobacter sp. S3L5C]|uniref:M15 family metallopeptidase n=1 Tax=Methylobacter sp. S3L5C TaxID=2839024 RepID=UPI001FABDB09|nr:M15 family metallopeptidase [Methylobacter sp. S3L5C]UOA09886.1 D-alanyl-D-alanine carboxypeptidase family protein [Methylobacter sp. S3L5C]
MNPHLASLNTALGIKSELIVARGLHVYEEASSFEVAEIGADGRYHLLVAAAAETWRNLKIAAHNDGIELFIVSAFRSVNRQTEIIRRKIAAGMAVEEILTVSAPPGFSEHHTGRAVDITTPGSRPLEVEFEQTAAFAWLNAHAVKFGYYLSYPIGNHCGYQYEPWHWCFNDVQPFAQEGLATPPP